MKKPYRRHEPGLVDLVRIAQQILAAGMIAAGKRDRSNLTGPQLAILRELDAAERNGPLSQTEIVKRTRIDRSTVCQMIPTLAKRKLVIKKADEDDGRGVLVSITTLGHSEYLRRQKQVETAEIYVINLLPFDQRSIFTECLRTIAERTIDA